MTATIVTDNFLSQFHSEPEGFSIVESPVRDRSRSSDMIYTEVRFDHKDRLLTVFKAAMSGRPVYYQIDSKGNFFCSTHISVLRMAGVEIAENAPALPEFFVFRYVMPPHTSYKNIYALHIGGRLRVRISGKQCTCESVERYDQREQDDRITSIESAAQRMRDLLSASLSRLETRRDEITVLLSGGIDSSTLCKMSQRNLGIETSYSTAYPFEDAMLDLEKKYALTAQTALGSNHVLYEATLQDYLTGFLEAIAIAEQPLHHLQSVCFHLLFKHGIPRDKKIIIQGLGAGGCFGNFRNYLYLKDKRFYQILSSPPLRRMVKVISAITNRGKRLVDALEKGAAQYPLADPRNPLWSAHEWYGSKKWVCDYFGVGEEDIIEKQYQSIRQFEKRSVYDVASLYALLGDEAVTLSIWSKIGEGNGRILYSPFYDCDILNFAYSIPWKVKLRRPENALRKEIARQSDVPAFIIGRPKSGFGIRTKDWSVKGGTFEPLVLLASKVFDEKQLRDMQSTDIDRAMTFWNMLNYAIWKRLCIDSEPLEALLEELSEAIRRHQKAV